MINHVKSKSPNVNTVNNAEAGVTQLQPAGKLGVFDTFAVERYGSKSQKDIKKHEIDEIGRQAKATISLVAHYHGSLVRAEVGRQGQEALAATRGAMFEGYQAIALVQSEVRQAGHDANTSVCNQSMQAAQQRLAAGHISHEQFDEAIATATSLRAHTEDRIAQRFEQLSQATDADFDATMNSFNLPKNRF